MSTDYFNDLQILEPTCPTCQSKIDYGTTTHYSDEEEAHICNSCDHVLS
jgi:hypothetical protein